MSPSTRRVNSEAWPSLVGHIDFSAENPDPLLVELLVRSSNEILRGRSAFCLMYPGSGCTGPEWTHLRKARGRRGVGRPTRICRISFAAGSTRPCRVIEARIDAAERGEA